MDIEKKALNRLNGTKVISYSCTPTELSNTIDLLPQPTQINPQAEITTKSEKMDRGFAFSMINSLSKGVTFDDDEQVRKSISFELAMALPKLSSNIIFSPKIKVLTQFSKNLVTGSIDTGNTNFDFAKANKVFFEYVVRESSAALLEILFNQIKEEIMKMVAALVAKLVKELATKKLNQIRSLTGGFDVKSGLSAINVPDVSQYL